MRINNICPPMFIAAPFTIAKTWKKPGSVVPNLFGPRDRFHRRQFFHGLGQEGWFQDNSNALHLLCTLFLLLLHQLHLRSSGIRFQRLETPDLCIVWLPRHLLMKSIGEFCPSLAIRSRAGWPESRAEESGLAPPPWL